MAKKQTTQSDYGAKDIYVLEGLEPVRKRPGMYIGSTGVDGLHHLVWEVVDNCIDEAMGGYADTIDIVFLPDHYVKVSDNGRGIPVDIHKQTKKSALETVMTTLHAGGKFGGDSYKISGGLHGVGVSVVNALSKNLKVEVCRDGALWVQEYKKGKPSYKTKKVGKCGKSGTSVTFQPDEEIFGATDEGGKKTKILPLFDWKSILKHLRQQAYLVRGIRINIKDEREEDSNLHKSYSFYFEGGVRSYVSYLNRSMDAMHSNVFYVSKEIEEHGMFVEVGLQYVDDLQAREMSFANNIYTPEGGMHVTGFRTALTRTLNEYAKKGGFVKDAKESFTGDDVREGLTTIISIKLKEPQFEGQTKAKLGNPEARTVTESVFSEAFSYFLEENPRDAKAILEKVFLALRARKAAKAAKDSVLRKGVLDGLTLPGKLSDCQTKDAEESELFIVEGDSAGGSCKQGRDRRFQAILPLKGKIMNVERARFDKMLASKEVKALIIAMGAAIADDFDISKLRYHRIIIATDADVDGSHIRTLLLTLFYRYFQPVIEGGYLYIAQPPLYKVQSGKTIQYAYDEEAKDKIIAELAKDKQARKKSTAKDKEEDVEEAEGGEVEDGQEKEEKIKGVRIQRYKGLGEMNPGQLWETTMDPANRILKQVVIEDAEDANRTFDILMGKEVAPRKNFIQTHAKTVENLDV
ncbi:MAG: DNA topoisomerase (ATP-hydrolyzing) subunit B [Candidatus Marinimicrobia bacterium]|nr:DNA topoisomerase (ATP-hydrolyzing) subunit B [Candidatus Neomarinimicrobiota bacterium]